MNEYESEPFGETAPVKSDVDALRSELATLRQQVQGQEIPPDRRIDERSEEIDAWAHCKARSNGGPDAEHLGLPGLCPGVEQERVRAIRITVDRYYLAGESYAHLIENSYDRLVWPDGADPACPFCGETRELTEQVRPRYDRVSPVPPDELLRRRHVRGHKPIRELLDANGNTITAVGGGGQDFATQFMQFMASMTAQASPPAPELEEELPKGIRRHGRKFQVGATIGGKWTSKTFETVDEAVAWREENRES